MTIEDQLKKLIVKYIDNEQLLDHLTDDSNLKETLNVDSLDMVELLLDIEREFEISIPDHEMQGVRTYLEFKVLIQSKLDN